MWVFLALALIKPNWLLSYLLSTNYILGEYAMFQNDDERIKDELGRTIEIDLFDILKACEGLDENKAPKAATNLDYFEFPKDMKSEEIDLDPTKELTQEEIEKISGKLKKTIFFKDVDLRIYMRGGSVVLQADFPPESRVEYNFIISILKEYMDMTLEEKCFHEIAVTVMPLIFEGQLFTIYRGLCYYTNYLLPRGYSRVCMVFDNGNTQWQEGFDIDYRKLERIVKNELQSEINQLDAEIENTSKEIKELETEANMFASTVKSDYGAEEILKNEEDNETKEVNKNRRTCIDKDLV